MKSCKMIEHYVCLYVVLKVTGKNQTVLMICHRLIVWGTEILITFQLNISLCNHFAFLGVRFPSTAMLSVSLLGVPWLALFYLWEAIQTQWWGWFFIHQSSEQISSFAGFHFLFFLLMKQNEIWSENASKLNAFSYSKEGLNQSFIK